MTAESRSAISVLPTGEGSRAPRISVVIPCYRVTAHVADVIARIGPEVTRIYCVDDACPDGSGRYIAEMVRDTRLTVLYNETNRGVGGATMAGYRRALADASADIVVKLDGDGQMDPALIPRLVRPIVNGRADYAKGNRFFDLSSLTSMPTGRLFGNAVLSFVTKLSSGYWQIVDPTNGFTAIHVRPLAVLPLDKVSRRYFFESDMLFRLNTFSAVVEDVPMDAVYGNERSNLHISRVWRDFAIKNFVNFNKRVFYNYFLRGFSIASAELLLGTATLIFGVVFGATEWATSVTSGRAVTAGTVMLAALPVMLGVQLLLSFLAFDMRSVPTVPLHQRI
jgi:dolichol-phosphate mannosyltransferase